MPPRLVHHCQLLYHTPVRSNSPLPGGVARSRAALLTSKTTVTAAETAGAPPARADRRYSSTQQHPRKQTCRRREQKLPALCSPLLRSREHIFSLCVHFTAAAAAAAKNASCSPSLRNSYTCRSHSLGNKRSSPDDNGNENQTNTTVTTNMSDQDYASFLDKASDDQHQAGSTSTSRGKTEQFTARTFDDKDNVPEALRDAASADDAVYVSDSDEQFVPVSLPFDEGDEKKLDAASFARATHLNEKDVEALSAKQFDARGQYKKLIDAVQKEGHAGSQPLVFRVQLKGARAEYWIVATTKASRLVGVKAGAVES